MPVFLHITNELSTHGLNVAFIWVAYQAKFDDTENSRAE